MRRAFLGIFFSFPVQLLLLHIKKHQLQLFIWFILFAWSSSLWGSDYGINYLFLDPEYLDKVTFYSFFILGITMGGFIMTWNITSYILNAFRFPFLATLRRPFGIYCLNNAIIPTIFVSIFIWKATIFQLDEALANSSEIIIYIAGLLIGILTMVGVVTTYFFNTNKDIFQLIGLRKKKHEKKETVRMINDPLPVVRKYEIRVDNYLNQSFRTRLVRGVAHYDPSLILSVYRQHHSNALFVEITTLAVLVGLGYMIENPLFLIPAAGSILLLFSILMILTSAVSYWVRGWRATMYIALLLGLNFLMQFEFFNYRNKAYGLNYENESALYTNERINELTNDDFIRSDKAAMLQVLNNWKSKFGSRAYSRNKPKLVFINFSGGGSRAALFSMKAMQMADSISGGKLFKNTFLMTGASGGMLGAAYFRELKYREQLGQIDNIYDEGYAQNIARDFLNPICFTIIVNDLFFPWRRFNDGPYTYRIDRGYIFERQLNANTGSVMNRTIAEYRQPERDADIPIMILSPTVINNERRLHISSQPVSFLTRPTGNVSNDLSPEIDGVEFTRMFASQDAYNLRFTSALRMNATFPYILPNTFLPSDPPMEVMDAGLRDNFGIETSVRFIFNFKEWINRNTGGVVIIKVRGHQQFNEPSEEPNQSFLKKLSKPLSNLYDNWSDIQDYQHDQFIDYANDWLNGKVEVINLQYLPAENEKLASLSWRLTEREKERVLMSAKNIFNLSSMQRLKEILE